MEARMFTIWKQEGKNLVRADKPEKDCWIDVRDADNNDLSRLENEFGIPSDLLTDFMDVDEQSRVEYEDDYTALILRLPVHDSSYEVSYFTLPLGVVIFADKMITVCQRNSDALDFAGKVKNLNLSNRTTLLLHILGRAAFSFLKDLKELNRISNIVEKELQKAVENNELVQLLSIQKSLVFFTTSIKSNELLLEKLRKGPLVRHKEAEHDILDDVRTENAQALEMANIYSGILTGTMDAFASVISNNMNIVMKRLTIINIVLMIPTLIYSFYGMNVAIPLGHVRIAWVVILTFSVLIALAGVIVLSFSINRRAKIPSSKPVRHSCCG
jgi:magnesium transporter